MNDALYNKFHDLFNDEIQGGSSDDMWGMIDRWIDEGLINVEDWHDNETAVCFLFDNNWFTCEQCGWTVPISEMSEDGWKCTDCD